MKLLRSLRSPHILLSNNIHHAICDVLLRLVRPCSVSSPSPQGNQSTQIEKISRDIKKMSKDQKLTLLATESPELLALVSELKSKVAELRDKINPIRTLLQEYAAAVEVDDDVVDYLEVKHQLLLAYCINVVFYLAMKCEGQSVRSHPVMKQLLELRYAMEKLRPLDGKLKYQIDRLISAAAMPSAELAALAFRPDPSAFDADSGGESEEEKPAKDKNNSRTDKKTDLYRAPKIAAAPYKFDESAEDKVDKIQQRKRNKLKNSAIFESLRDEFGVAPEMSSSSGIDNTGHDAKSLQKEEDDRRNYEEDRFIRLTMTRKDKQSIKKRKADAQRLDTITDIGDIGGIDEFDDLKVGWNKSKAATSSVDDDATSAALRKAIGAFTKGKTGATDEKSSKRRRAPDFAMDDINLEEGNEFDGLLEDYSRRKKEFEAEKKSHYTQEPRYGGLEVDEVSDGKKRAASYEIIKNRGLTPHRKKANRNPRVKKREMYAKAVINRKGQVREVITGAAGSYGGESTGIKSGIAKSRKILN